MAIMLPTRLSDHDTRTPRPPSLRLRLVLVLGVVQILVLIGLAAFVVAQSRRVGMTTTMDELQRLTPMLVQRYAGLTTDHDDLRRRVMEDARATGLRLTVIDAGGLVLADSVDDPADMSNLRYRPEVDMALRAGHGTTVQRSASGDMAFHAMAMPTGGVLRVGMAIQPEAAVLSRFVVGFIIAAATGAIITALVVMLAWRGLGRGLDRVRGAFKQLESDRPMTHLHEPPYRELTPLVTAFNDLSRSLRSHLADLTGQRSELDTIVQSMDTALLALDMDQRVIRLNRAARTMLGIPHANTRGRLVQEVAPYPGLLGFIAGTPTEPGEFEINAGRRKLVRAVSLPLRDGEGTLIGQLVMMTDITRVQALETMRSDFAANVSHELRTPITNIRGYAETLLETPDLDGPTASRFLGIIAHNATRLGTIIEDMLTLTRLEGDESRDGIELKPIRVRELIDAAVNLLSNKAYRKGVRIVLDVEQDLLVTVDREMIEQALVNLLSNAITYGPADATITVYAVHETDGHVSIGVIDEGPGIAPEHLPRLFERFYRVDKARSRQGGGTGLGLAIVKHIALAHGGRVEAESTVGRGSTFRLILPGVEP